MPTKNSDGSCLSCMHYERMYRVCKFDYPKGFRKAAGKPRPVALRIGEATDVRTFRCPDYLGWEVSLLPFTTSRQVELPIATASASE